MAILFFLAFSPQGCIMRTRSGRVGLCVLQSAGGTGSCPPDETAKRRAVQIPHPAAAYLDRGKTCPALLCAANPYGLPCIEEVFL